MRLPIPNAKEVEEFRRLCKEQYNIDLNDQEAFEEATRLVHLICLLNDAIYPLSHTKSKNEQGESESFSRAGKSL